MMKFFVESFNKEHQRSTHTCGDRVSGEKRRLLPTLLHCHAAQQAVGTVQPKRQWRRAVAQWEGLSAAPVGVKGMHPFPLLLPRTLALGSHPRPGPGSARCTGAQLSACQKFKFWAVLCRRPLTRASCGPCGMVDDAAAHVQGFEGPRQNGLHPRDFSCHRLRAPPGPFGLFNSTGAHGDPPPAGCSCGLYLAPLPRFFKQGWLAQPSPTTLSPFDPNSYSL